MTPLNPSHLKVLPLAKRRSLSRIEDILIEPGDVPPPASGTMLDAIGECAMRMTRARESGAGVSLIYGAHLIKNGGQLLLNQLIDLGWITHLATNGAGTIHDWEFAWNGRSTESVRENVATGTFGTWDETGRYLHLALLAGGVQCEGYGRAVGRMIQEDGVTLPSMDVLMESLRREPEHPLASARADLLRAMRRHGLAAGRQIISHRYRKTSVLAQAFRQDIPLTVHPGIGYDIIANHPFFDGGVIGRAAGLDFGWFGAAVERLDGGVLLCIGSAIMGPQVFEKSLSGVNNLRLQSNRPVVQGHSIYVIDLQDGGGWDWSQGEPPKESPAYYLRFCKTFARMGGSMRYLQCDNILFLHQLFHQLTDGSRRSA